MVDINEVTQANFCLSNFALFVNITDVYGGNLTEFYNITRQTVSNWENEKSYPELQILIAMSNQFDVSLDTLLKGDSKMVEAIDKERVLGKIKHEKSLVDFFTGAGTGLVASCFLSSASTIRTVVMIVGFAMIGIGWYKRAKSDKEVFKYMEENGQE